MENQRSAELLMHIARAFPSLTAEQQEFAAGTIIDLADEKRKTRQKSNLASELYSDWFNCILGGNKD